MCFFYWLICTLNYALYIVEKRIQMLYYWSLLDKDVHDYSYNKQIFYIQTRGKNNSDSFGWAKITNFLTHLHSKKLLKSLNFSLFWKNIKSSLIENAFGKKKVFTIAKKNFVLPMDGNHLKSPEHFWQKCNKKSWLFRQVSFRKLVILCGDGPSREKKMIGKPNHLLQHYFWCHTASSSRPQAKKVVVRC